MCAAKILNNLISVFILFKTIIFTILCCSCQTLAVIFITGLAYCLSFSSPKLAFGKLFLALYHNSRIPNGLGQWSQENPILLHVNNKGAIFGIYKI